MNQIIPMNTMTTEMTQTPQQRSLIDVEQSRVVQQVQGQILMAKRDPRDTMAAYTRIMKDLERPRLAETAIYSYEKGGQTVSGPSIRMAEVFARNYGNLDAGHKELDRQETQTICEAWCWDLETNYRMSRQFTVKHIRDTKGGGKQLLSERDIDELIANKGARKMRQCILAVIPADITQDATDRVRKVLSRKDGAEPLEDRIRKIVLAFKEVGVTQEMLETKLGHPVLEIIPDQFPELHGIFNALKDKTAKREKFFPQKKTDPVEALKNPVPSSPQAEPAATEPGGPAPATSSAEEQQRLDMVKRVQEKIAIAEKTMDKAELVMKLGMAISMVPKASIEDLTRAYKALRV